RKAGNVPASGSELGVGPWGRSSGSEFGVGVRGRSRRSGGCRFAIDGERLFRTSIPRERARTLERPLGQIAPPVVRGDDGPERGRKPFDVVGRKEDRGAAGHFAERSDVGRDDG